MFQLGGGYLFGLPVGFIADSIGATIGATAAFMLGRTVSLESLHVHVSVCVCACAFSFPCVLLNFQLLMVVCATTI